MWRQAVTHEDPPASAQDRRTKNMPSKGNAKDTLFHDRENQPEQQHTNQAAGGYRQVAGEEEQGQRSHSYPPEWIQCRDYCHALRRLVRRSQRKNGAPQMAVTTPTGISTGESTIRDSVSHTPRNAAPNKKEQ